MTISIDDELIELQTRLAYQEDTIAQLNAVVTKQDAALLQLQHQMRLLAKRVDELSYRREPSDEAAPNERPPHY